MRQLGLMRWGALEAVRSQDRTALVFAVAVLGACLYVGHEVGGELVIAFEFGLAVLMGWLHGLAPASGTALPDPTSRGWAAWGGALTRMALASGTALAFALALEQRQGHRSEAATSAGIAALVALVCLTLRLLTRSTWAALLLGLPTAGFLAFRVSAFEADLVGPYRVQEGEVVWGTLGASLALCALACVLRPPRRSGAEEG